MVFARTRSLTVPASGVDKVVRFMIAVSLEGDAPDVM
jgi:hypothetical protein